MQTYYLTKKWQQGEDEADAEVRRRCDLRFPPGCVPVARQPWGL